MRKEFSEKRKPGEGGITGINTEDCGRSCQGGSPVKLVLSATRHTKWLKGLPRTDDHLERKKNSLASVLSEKQVDSLEGQQTEILVSFLVSNGGKEGPASRLATESLAISWYPKNEVRRGKLCGSSWLIRHSGPDNCGAIGAPNVHDNFMESSKIFWIFVRRLSIIKVSTRWYLLISSIKLRPTILNASLSPL
jgi:hypothetical protein